MSNYIIQALSKVSLLALSPAIFINKIRYQRKYENASDMELKKLPIKELLYLIIYNDELNLWNKIAAMIDYTYPMNGKLKKHSLRRQDCRELMYCVKYAAYAYFMPILGDPDSIIIDPKEKSLPFFGHTSKHIAEPGYFIGIDHENERILLCIRGTESIGDTITDLHATPKKQPFGKDKSGPEYFVHPGIYNAAINLHEEVNVTNMIKKHQKNYPKYKIFVTGHSLGAGVCSLLGLLWKSQNIFRDDEFKCFSFASPLVIDKDGVDKTFSDDSHFARSNNMISVAVSSDVVTRLSIRGLFEMQKRVGIIKSYNEDKTTKSSYELTRNICNKRCSSAGFTDFAEDEKEFIQRLTANDDDIKDDENNEVDLYPAGKVLWFVPHYTMSDDNDNQKYEHLLNRVKSKTSGCSLFRLIGSIYNILMDFEVVDNRELLCEINGDRNAFTQMIFNGNESFHAHFPGRYTKGFGIDIIDIFKMSKYSTQISDKLIFIPDFLMDVVLFWCVSILYLILSFASVAFVEGVYLLVVLFLWA